MEVKEVKTEKTECRKELLELFPAEMKEFIWYSRFGEKRRMIGKQYFLLNQAGRLEMYTIGKHTVPEELAQFIKEGRCFVLRRGSLIKD